MNSIIEEDYDSTSITEEDKLHLRECTVEGKWEEVKKLYESESTFCKININKSRGTALHVAVNDGKKNVVKSLVDIIVIKHKSEKALESKNDRGETPLHLAASRGFKDICEYIIGDNGERNYLIDIDNNEGETPLFNAALSWQKQTFVYLINVKLPNSQNYFYTKDFIRRNGDSILHCAIRREFFDLALIIMNKYPNLSDIQNGDGFSPLKLLATRPSAFRSGNKLIWWKCILYHCIPVGTLNVENVVEDYGMKGDESDQENEYPENYHTCCLFLRKGQEYVDSLLYFAKKMMKPTLIYGTQNLGGKQKEDHHFEIKMSEDLGHRMVPTNYDTCFWFLKFAYIYILGLSGIGVENLRKMKQKHKWSSQLLNLFMVKPYESYLGSGAQPLRNVSGTDFISAYRPKQENSDNEETTTTETETRKVKKTISETQKMETPILTAARNGIVEMVNVIITKIPSAIHETNLENKNVLLVAIENRRTLVIESLRKRFGNNQTKAVFDNLIQGVDVYENTALHLAATESDKDWRISGAALQMMWHIKWYQYVKQLVPEHFTVRTNKKEKTSGEIFKDSHAELVKNGSEWLKDTSESCSVVAALLAGVSFATSSTVPGGNRSETGEPTLEGKPAFDAFALSSVIGLCFSVTALIMFLSILTSRKEARDFRIDLPRKLLLGLSSLFVSIVAMFITFCSGHFFLIDHKYKQVVFLIYGVTCFPVSLYAVAQFPLYVDLLKGILTRVPKTSEKGEDI